MPSRTVAFASLAAISLLAPLVAGCHAKSDPPADKAAQAPPATVATARISAATRAAEVIRVPRAKALPKLDGELDESDWISAPRTGAFVDEHGAPARPFSEARFLWDATNLYVSLYAADDDIEAKVTTHDGPVWLDDAFSLRISPAGMTGPLYLIDISAGGTVTDVLSSHDTAPARPSTNAAALPNAGARWESGLKLGIDRDGTVGDASDDDEEWVVETAIPLASMGISPTPGTRFVISIGRCDTPKGTGPARRCGGWGEAKGAERALELAAD